MRIGAPVLQLEFETLIDGHIVQKTEIEVNLVFLCESYLFCFVFDSSFGATVDGKYRSATAHLFWLFILKIFRTIGWARFLNYNPGEAVGYERLEELRNICLPQVETVVLTYVANFELEKEKTVNQESNWRTFMEQGTRNWEMNELT